jgi:carbon storage regulator CsrA
VIGVETEAVAKRNGGESFAAGACPARGRATLDENGGSTMLVLTRKKEEAVMVGGAAGFERLLKVTVLEIEGGTVRLGFEVDAVVPVHRLEVWERLRATGQPVRPGGGPAGPGIG